MKKRLLSLLTCMALLGALAAGCSSDDSSQPASTGDDPISSAPAADPTQQPDSEPDNTPSGDTVTLTYAIWDSNQEPGLRTMADEFEADNPDVKINIEVSTWDEYWTILEAGATGGDMPDVFWMHSNEIYRYASNGMLYNLNDYIAGSDLVSMSNFPSGLVEIYNHEGNQYAVPKDYDTIGLWYNKTLFDEAELDYPDNTWTWDDLYAAAEALTSGDGSQYGILTPLHNQEGYYNFIYQNGGTVITADKESGYDDPKTVEALEFYVKFIEDGLSPQEYGDSERVVWLQSGAVAMGFFGSWNLAGFTENEYMAENFDVAVLPASNGGGRASIFNGLGHAIPHNAENPDAAWRFVEYLGSQEGQTRQAELGVAISAYNGSADTWVSSNTTFDIGVYIEMVDYAQIRPYSNTTAQWEDRMYEILKDSFTGDRSVADVCADAAEAMNAILEQER